MTFGSFHFRIGKEGSHRLAIPNSSGSFMVDSDFLGSSSLFESGEEEILPSSFSRPASSRKLGEIFGSMSFGSTADSNIGSNSDSIDSFDFIDRSTSVREVLADLYDGVTDPKEEDEIPKYHQVCAIGDSSRQADEASEAFDDLGNPYIDPADLTRGLGNKYVGTDPRQRVQLAQEAWDRATRAMDGTEPMTTTATAKETMPFGLKNAGATYQRMMQKCLTTQIGKNVQVYINDVVITTKQRSSLIDDLKETFHNLDKFCLNLNPTKCSFGVPAGEFLGFLVSARGIEANPEKIQAIITMRKPTKLKEIQQLTGRVAALSIFVARLGEKVLPFYALIKQGEKFEWNKEADRAFKDLKRTISTPPILVAPKDKEPLLLYIAATPQLVAQQAMDKCDAVNDSMIAYKEVYDELEKLFDGCEVNRISRLSNDEAGVLANIGSHCLPIPPGVFWEEISERSTKPKKLPKQPKKQEKPKKGSGAPENTEASMSEDEEESHEVMMIEVPWMQVYVAYIMRKEIPQDLVEARRVIRRSKAFTVVKGEL
ncbi:hypothetical protein QYE76_064489 [Lolium multiflorum]|uniref:Reverse transcriptase domain-containing protein n=1 Tax=Lolium multiflorum TaxID=4521 RepID=A0AAD8WA12_LOLMU|nr:hypothetical protein QYE76_064489 [Lolium multiflorum]